MGDLLNPPHDKRRRRRGRRRKSAATAAIVVIPSARHQKIVDYVVTQMKGKPSLDAAEAFLISHLDLEWSRLADLGLTDTEIERHCDFFARAAWRIVFDSSESEGIA